MKRIWFGLAAGMFLGGAIAAQKPPLLPESEVAALAGELSGQAAKRNLEAISENHRQRGSKGFHAAAEIVVRRLREYGLEDAAILQFPSDGRIFYGTQRSRPAWDAELGELTEVSQSGEVREKIASYREVPVVLAEDSESAEVRAELIDLGQGTRESDYAGKAVRGKIVLVGAQPGAVQDLAVGKFGAVGIVSYAQNQKTAWWGEDQNLIRWGHLDSFSPNKTFGFMISLGTAGRIKQRLSRGEKITLQAVVKASQHPGSYEVATGTIPGADPELKQEEIAFSCHLDHQRPGANDNASGCATILEVARSLHRLIGSGKLVRPARTIRFLFPPEIEGTLALLSGKPELSTRIKAVVHMDMVGGGPETKAVFHVTRGPLSLPSFTHEVAWAFAEWVNQESYRFAATGQTGFPLLEPEGGKEPLRAEDSAYTMGSDHDVYQDSSFGIPAIYLNDWPDRYIHTQQDQAAHIDPTKLKRAGFIGAASGYFLARMDPASFPELTRLVAAEQLRRVGSLLAGQEPGNLEERRFERVWLLHERGIADSIGRFAGQSTGSPPLGAGWDPKLRALLTADPDPAGAKQRPAAGLFRRAAKPRGPLGVFGYDYFQQQAEQARLPAPRLLGFAGLRGAGEEYAYEVLNLADGKRTVEEIRDAVSAEYGPVPLEFVLEYLEALEKIGLVEPVR